MFNHEAQGLDSPSIQPPHAGQRMKCSAPSFGGSPDAPADVFAATRSARIEAASRIHGSNYMSGDFLRASLIKFARHYDETWLVVRHGYRTPAQVRADQCRLDQQWPI